MKKFLSSILIGCGLIAGILAPTIPAVAVSCPPGSARSSADSLPECSTEETDGDASLMSRIKIILNVIIGLVGLAAVAMIIIGGATYVTSQGNPEKTKKGRDILIYSVIGLVVALLSFAIVNFVMTNVFK